MRIGKNKEIRSAKSQSLSLSSQYRNEILWIGEEYNEI